VSTVSLRNIPLCPITRAAFGACARASSNAVFHSNKSSEVSAYFRICAAANILKRYKRHKNMFCYLKSIISSEEFNYWVEKEMQSTLRVNARPSRPSGKRTVNNFLSSLTTTLQIRSALSTVFQMHNPNKKEDKKGVQE